MNKKTACYILIGIIIGWLTLPLVKADDSGSWINSLHRIVNLLEDIKTIDQQIADNTKSMHKKLGVQSNGSI